MSSTASTVAEYLAELTPERRRDVSTLRRVIKATIPKGYQEAMNWGMITYQVPIKTSGPTYNKQPLAAVALAAQKNNISIYLLSIYASKKLTKEFQKRWSASGKKLDMGKSCIRFRSLEHADLETIAWAASLLTPKEFVEMYKDARASRS